MMPVKSPDYNTQTLILASRIIEQAWKIVRAGRAWLISESGWSDLEQAVVDYNRHVGFDNGDPLPLPEKEPGTHTYVPTHLLLIIQQLMQQNQVLMDRLLNPPVLRYPSVIEYGDSGTTCSIIQAVNTRWNSAEADLWMRSHSPHVRKFMDRLNEFKTAIAEEMRREQAEPR